MRVKEPFNTVSHLFGAVLSLGGMVPLLRSAPTAWHRAAFLIYGASLVVLYTASTVYHLVPGPPRICRRLQKLDHSAIFLLIAGSYTPVALITLHGPWGWTLLGVVWTVAAVGIPLKFTCRLPDWVSTGLYLVMGYLVLIAAGPLLSAVPPGGLALLVAGGLAYTIGAVIFHRERPNPLPGLGHHELWHLLVLAGSACHYAFMFYYVRPAAL